MSSRLDIYQLVTRAPSSTNEFHIRSIRYRVLLSRSYNVTELIIYYRYRIIYSLSSRLRSNYEEESRVHICAFAKPLVSQGCLPHFPTKIFKIINSSFLIITLTK